MFVAVGHALAIDPGESGGGNICKLSEPPQNWVLIDRLKEQNQTSHHPVAENQISLPQISVSPLQQISLMKSTALKDLLSYITDYQKASPNFTYVVLIKMIKAFDRVYLSHYPQAFVPQEVDYSVTAKCAPGSIRSAALSLQSGNIFLSSFGVTRLSEQDKRLLIIHEVFRFLQITLSPDSLNNETLTEWTVAAEGLKNGGLHNLSSFYAVASDIYYMFEGTTVDELKAAQAELSKLTVNSPIPLISQTLAKNFKLQVLHGDDASFEMFLNDVGNRKLWDKVAKETLPLYLAH